MALDTVRIYTKQYARAIQSVFSKRAAFANAFAPTQTLDGVANNAVAFTVKTNDTPVVLNTYNTGANVAFGTGTDNTSRFGPLSEIIYSDVDVPYDTPLSFNEGLDMFTTNEDMDYAVSQRLIKIAEKQLDTENTKRGAHLAAKAGSTIALASGGINEANIKAAFSQARAFYTNAGVMGEVTAFVTADVYDILIESGLTTTEKNSSTNIDTNDIVKYKDFIIQSEKQSYFAGTDCIYFCANGINLPFVGIEIARTLTAVPGFAGTQLQGASKGGRYVDDINKMAIVKVSVSA